MALVCLLVIVVHFFTCRSFIRTMKETQNALMLQVLPLVIIIPVFGIFSYEVVRHIVALENVRQCQSEWFSEIFEGSDQKRPTYYTQDTPEQMIPFEEAILLNDEATRRKLMLCILRQEPAKFLDLLKIARFDTDVEVTHYATTTIMEIQRRYDLMLAQVHEKHLAAPEDARIVESYIEILQEYIGCGLLSGYLLRQQSLRLQGLLKRKLMVNPSCRGTLEALARSYLAAKDYENAEGIVRELCMCWPNEEDVWILAVGVCIESRNRTRKAALRVLMSRTEIQWTSKGQEFMKYVYGENFLMNYSDSETDSSKDMITYEARLIVAASGYGR